MEKVGGPIPAIWWLHPGALFTLVCGSVIVAAWLIPASVYQNNWGSTKYFDDATFLFGLGAVAVFAIGVSVSRPRSTAEADNPEWASAVDWPRAQMLFRLCCGLCFAGYAIWAGAAISRGANLELVQGVLTGEKDATYLMKDTYLVTLGGLTTLTQFGIAAVILGCVLASAGYWRAVRLPLLAVIGLAVARAVFNSERLAVFELIVPAAVVLLQLPATTARLRRDRPWLFYILPVAGALGVFFVFTGSEYLRSWVNFYAERESSIWEFAATRISGYYVTACNNSAYLLRQTQVPIGVPFYTVLFLWRFPLVNAGMRWLFPSIMTGQRDIFSELLDAGTNPEFNNNGGLFLPMVDYDVFGGLLYWLAAGVVCGWCYRNYRRNTMGGILFYPIMMLSILEIPRIIYWAEGRVFPSLALLLIAVPLLRVRRATVSAPQTPRPVAASNPL